MSGVRRLRRRTRRSRRRCSSRSGCSCCGDRSGRRCTILWCAVQWSGRRRVRGRVVARAQANQAKFHQQSLIAALSVLQATFIAHLQGPHQIVKIADLRLLLVFKFDSVAHFEQAQRAGIFAHHQVT